MYNGIDRWHHLDCFVKLRNELGFFEVGTSLPGAKSLSLEDQNALKIALPKIKNSDIPPPSKKLKTEPEDAAESKQMKEQNELMFKMRDNLSRFPKKELDKLLINNKQQIPESTSDKLDALADIMFFGALKPCPKCKGQFVYVSGLGYKCTGNLTEWTKCEEVTQNPSRTKFSIPKSMKENDFFSTYKPMVRRRLIRVTAPSTSSAVKKEEDTTDGPKIKGKILPLKGMQFIILNSTKDKEELRREIMLLGGMVVGTIHENIAAIIATPAYVKKDGKKVQEARAADIQIVSEDFVEEAEGYISAPTALISKKSICDWGSDPSTRVAASIAKSASRGKSVYEKSSSGKVKLKIKGGVAVDPKTELEDVAHVYQDGSTKYNVTLGITDIQAGKNSYYKMQVLKHDKHNQYWFFRAWGRIGTSIGDHRLEDLSLDDCIDKFHALYLEKTGNHWQDRNNFVKKPGLMHPIDVDHGEEDPNFGKFESSIESKLKKPVQDLIKLIFDVDTMKKVMMEFELDMDKMPLGKLSKKQLEKAYAVLTELLGVIKTEFPDRLKLIDASNRFYTLVPHSFGVANPPILDNEEIIKNKCDMLDSLMEMEIAYNLLSVKSDSTKNPIDLHYEQLNTDIDVIDKSSKEFDIIKQYVKNTHAATHTQYELIVEEVYVVKRQVEEQRFKPFKKLPNRKLLWHGSRVTNYAGILSQGLRIAPPEAPVTGYMFGKGIYFADMVSKSANYCCTNRASSTGLLMLCEVALGNMYEKLQAEYIEKLPKGKHSTFGRGLTEPDPNQVYTTEDGVVIPYGPGVPANIDKGRAALLYNEYIVYDVAQVKAKYLVKMNFKYKF